MKEPYTKITFEVYYPIKNDYSKYSVVVNRWDLGLDEAYELIDQLLAGAGYQIDRDKQL